MASTRVYQAAEVIRDDTFVINDLPLVIPPTAISIQKEDLVYDWRTLRSKTSTKIPSGHGNISIQVSCVFTRPQLLDMHRLMTQLKSSPFCYIENRFLRESIVPQWSDARNMAFSLQGVSVNPLPGSVDSWQVAMQFTWFNYAPYSSNFLFREEWETNWLQAAGQSQRIKQSIGWVWDGDERINQPSITNISDEAAHAMQQYDVQKEELLERGGLSIFEMEALHMGEEWDLLPLPNNMAPSKFVYQPMHSKIYTRWCNLIQADALKHNYGIDVRADLGDMAPMFFGSVADGEKRTIFSLHMGPPSHFPTERRIWQSLAGAWRDKLLSYAGGVRFVFEIYRQVEFDPSVTNQLADSNRSVLDEVIAELDVPVELTPTTWIETKANGAVNARYPIRRELTNPNGFHSIIQKENGEFFTMSEMVSSMTSELKTRNRVQGDSSNTRVHWGNDIAQGAGGPTVSLGMGIAACRSGVVTKATTLSNADGIRWYIYSTRTGKTPKVVDANSHQDWYNSLRAAVPQAMLQANKNSRPQFLDQYSHLNAEGYWCKSVTWPDDVVYFAGPGASGRYIEVRHEDGAKSLYMHMMDVNVSVGDRVEAGEIIGTMGNSAKVDAGYLSWWMNTTSAESGFGQDGARFDPYSPSWAASEDNTTKNRDRWPGYSPSGRANSRSARHLHFEYWEPADINDNVLAPDMTTDLARWKNNAWRGMVAVDIVGSWRKAKDPNAIILEVDQQGVRPEVTDAVEKAAQKAVDSGALDENIAIGLQQQIVALYEDGWTYYDREHITNVWSKKFAIEVGSRDLQELNALGPETFFAGKDVVLTNEAGGISNMMATIPVLGHEYPTQQFMGSMEPMYNLEFYCNDLSLEGLSATGGFLEGMRSVLQHNARHFRAVKDSWCVSTDSFTTRLLGTFRDNDILEATTVDDDGNPLVADRILKKRTAITRADSGTVEGSPGLSYMRFDLGETNPYEEPEKLLVSDSDDAREAYSKILNAIHSLDFADKYKETALLALFVQVAEADGNEFTDYTNADILATNQLSALTWGNDSVALYGENISAYEEGNADSLLVRDPGGAYAAILKAMDLDYVAHSDSTSDFLQIPLEQTNIGFEPDVTTGTSDFRGPGEVSGSINSQSAFRGTADLSSVLEQDGFDVLRDIPFEKIADYYILVRDLFETVEMTMAEHESLISDSSKNMKGSGLPVEEVQFELYDLPVEPQMWRQFQTFTADHASRVLAWDLDTIGTQGDGKVGAGSRARTALHANKNWLTWSQPLDAETRSRLGEFVPNFTSAMEDAANHIGNIFGALFEAAGETFSRERIAAGRTANINKTMAEATREVNQDIVDFYIGILPSRQERIRRASENLLMTSIIGDLLVAVDGEQGEGTLTQTLHNQLYNNLLSCGHFTWDFTNGVRFNIGDKLSINEALEDAGNPAKAEWSFAESFGLKEPTSRTEAPSWPLWEYGIPAPGSPMAWVTIEDTERQKLRRYETMFAKIAREIRLDPELLKAFGLERYAFSPNPSRLRGNRAYPDLDLPAHPYYGDTSAMGPDFYMWNIYEDGGARKPELMAEVQESAEFVIERSYKSMQKLQEGEDYDPAKDPYVVEGANTGETLVIKSRYAAEGSDQNYRSAEGTPMGSPFYPDSQSASGVAEFNGEDLRTDEDPNSTNGPVRTVSGNADQLKSVKVDNVRLSNAEGFFGDGGGVHYPRRTSTGNYERLKEMVAETEQMFGTQMGTADEKFDPEVIERLKGTAAAVPDEYAHQFDENSIKSLAKNSSKDIVSQKRTMRRAYPTFKLFFVEESSHENRLLSFDDFHSYSGVTEFTVVQSRKSPADHAVITLQNVSGSLDGSKRGSISDIETDDEKTDFSSVVLRPGINVQLRAGYSDDPDNLHVLISGRAQDIQWNSRGDLVEITVQSFGTELVQVLKGAGFGADQHPVYHTTHQLLGALMLEPELQHFGRWGFGKLYQVGEGKDARLDFHDYSNDGNTGIFTAGQFATRSLMSSPWILGGIAAGTLLLSAVPLPVGKIGKIPYFSKLFARAGVSSRLLGANANRALLRKTYTKAIGADDVTKATKIASLTAGQQARLVTSVSNHLDDVANVASKAGATDDVIAAIVQAKHNQLQALRNGLGTIDDIALGGASVAREASVGAGKGMWRTVHGAWQANSALSGSVKTLGLGLKAQWAIGKQSAKIIAASTAAGIALSALALPIKATIEGTVGRIKQFFAATQVALFLSPQDDNLFPPHPKDYMKMSQGVLKDFGKALVLGASGAAGTLVGAGAEVTETVARWIDPSVAVRKSVDPEACEYVLDGQTIWDVFHEMSLRHPGWIYGTRPYGNEFRYTMFFGVPSQRYWSKPASNTFIARANKLSKVLAQGPVNEATWRNLYGETFDGRPLEDAIQSIRQEVTAEVESSRVAVGAALREEDQSVIDELVESRVEAALTGPALQEYLRALNTRFEPFRRYHHVSSDSDLVWNGIISSESSVYNAVDVTYYKTSDDDPDRLGNPEGSAFFKAHATLPEHLTNALPMHHYRNCRSYPMAMRYGMGTLLHTMREMYRGEFIVLGNPRIRPWDICLLMDSYNDMMGPVEVEQVVHTFSHQTGFITEVKPNAVVFGNEISSLPILSGLQIWALAMKDIENSYSANFTEDFGVLNTIAEVLRPESGAPLALAQERKDRAFDDAVTMRAIFGGQEPDFDSLSQSLGFDPLADLKSKDPVDTFTEVATRGVFNPIETLGFGIDKAFKMNNSLGTPSMTAFLGSYLLLLQCLREESIIVVPLIKNGNPIVSGMNHNDPSALWKNFRGDMVRAAEDLLNGTEDMLSMWQTYGTAAWRQVPTFKSTGQVDAYGVNTGVDLTGAN